MNIPDFYPTPPSLISKMLNGINFQQISTVLEPSAGKGDIALAVFKKIKDAHYRSDTADFDIDCVEINENLQSVLKGKGARVIHDDFLTLNTGKRYDLIAMNPPFSDGDKHLLKALEMQRNGGKIVCLLNAETLKNPYTNTRKDLVQQLEERNADIKYIGNAFSSAERKTDVETAIIKIDIPRKAQNSQIIDDLKKSVEKEYHEKDFEQMVEGDFILGIVRRYEFEVSAGLSLIHEYDALKPLMSRKFKSDSAYDAPILELTVPYRDEPADYIENLYIKKVRQKYWNELFQSDKFSNICTEKLRQQYIENIGKLKDYDFSLYNIRQMQIDVSKQLVQSLDDTILSLFDSFTYQAHWDNSEMCKNIHYYSGWKTNKAYIVNKRVIIRLAAFSSYDGRNECGTYSVVNKLSDIEKVFNYLSGSLDDNSELREILSAAQKSEQSAKIKTKYFLATFYKKGTCHLEFTDAELLKKFNLFGSQHKGWLPPSYGKAEYKDMSKEEKSVVDEFEGKDEYAKTMANKEFYFANASKVLMLGAGA